MADTTPSTDIKQGADANAKVNYEVTKNPLAEKFQNISFKKDTEEKILKISHLSPFMKSLIVSSTTKFYNNHIWDGKGEQTKSINFSRFNEILNHMDLTEDQEKDLMYEYKKKDKLFQNQNDDLIGLFAFVLPKNMEEYDTEQRTMTLIEAVNGAYLKMFGTHVNYTPSSMKAGDLSMIGDLNAQKLGVNPRDSLKKVRENNPNCINEVFKFLLASQNKSA